MDNFIFLCSEDVLQLNYWIDQGKYSSPSVNLVNQVLALQSQYHQLHYFFYLKSHLPLALASLLDYFLSTCIFFLISSLNIWPSLVVTHAPPFPPFSITLSMAFPLRFFIIFLFCQPSALTITYVLYCRNCFFFPVLLMILSKNCHTSLMVTKFWN